MHGRSRVHDRRHSHPYNYNTGTKRPAYGVVGANSHTHPDMFFANKRVVPLPPPPRECVCHILRFVLQSCIDSARLRPKESSVRRKTTGFPSIFDCMLFAGASRAFFSSRRLVYCYAISTLLPIRQCACSRSFYVYHSSAL